MAYSEKMKQLISIELDKTEYFNNYEFSEKFEMFLIDVPVTICNFSIDISIMLTERTEAKVAGRIIDKIDEEYKSEVEDLVDLFNEHYCEEGCQYIFEDSHLFYIEEWESSIYSIKDTKDYNAKEDLKELKKLLSASPFAYLVPLCQALKKIIDENMSAEDAFIDVLKEE